MRAAHRDDLALDVAVECAPRALVDHEGRLARHARVRVRLCDNPRGRVGDSLGRGMSISGRRGCVSVDRDAYEVEDLPGRDEVVQAVHDFLDAAGPVPLSRKIQ